MKLSVYVILVLLVGWSCSDPDTTRQKSSGTSSDTLTNKQAVTLTTKDGVAEIQMADKNGAVALPAPKPSEKRMESDNMEDDSKDSLLDLRRARTAFNNGIQYYKSGELDQASDAFKLALTYKPDNDKAYYNLGKIYYEQDQKELSLSFYEDALEINPNDSASATAAGLIYFEQGNFDKAMYWYNHAISVAPAYGLAYYNRGTLLGQQKKYNEALQDLNTSIQLDTANANVFMNRGLAFFYLKRQDEACKDWKHAAKMGLESAQKAVEIYCKEKPGN